MLEIYCANRLLLLPLLLLLLLFFKFELSLKHLGTMLTNSFQLGCVRLQKGHENTHMDHRNMVDSQADRAKLAKL